MRRKKCGSDRVQLRRRVPARLVLYLRECTQAGRALLVATLLQACVAHAGYAAAVHSLQQAVLYLVQPSTPSWKVRPAGGH